MPQHAPVADESKRPWPLGKRLKAAREAAGLSQREASAAAGFSVTTWGQLETGVKKLGGGLESPMNPRASIVMSAAQVVGMDPAEALRMAGIAPERHVPSGSQRPTVSQSRLLEYFARLTEGQRAALLNLIESMLPSEDGEAPAIPPMGEPKAAVVSRTSSKQRR
jgi:transcriptional regulator with XRE-family HTH domain